MRKAKGVLGVIAGLMLLFHAGGTVAVASDHRNSPPGNNGTIKIHEGAGEQDPVQANDPHVCTFHIHGFNFDSNASGTWRLEQQAPTGNAAMGSGTWTADGSGDWRTAVMTLPKGHYQAHAKQTVTGTPGGEKTKTFWVECGQSTTTGGGTGTTTTTTGGTTGSSGGSSGGTTGGEQGSLSGTQSKSKNGGSKSGTKSKSKAGGSATGTGSLSNGASNSNGSVNGTDNTGSVSDHGEGTTTGGATSGGTSSGTTTAGSTTSGTTTTGSTAGGTTTAGSTTGTNGTNGSNGNGTGNANGNANGNGSGGQGNVTGGSTQLPGNGAGGATSGGTATGGQGNVKTTSGEVLGQGVSPSVQILPSTTTAGDSAPLAIFGGLLVAFGAFLVRKTPGQSR